MVVVFVLVEYQIIFNDLVIFLCCFFVNRLIFKENFVIVFYVVLGIYFINYCFIGV